MNRILMQCFPLFFFLLFLHPRFVFADETEYITVRVYSNTYYGTLTENADGDSVFTSLPTEDKQFIITGKWKTDRFSGKCTISYSDGVIEEVSYKKAKINGKVKTIYPDGTMRKYSCYYGKPYGKITWYSSSGEKTQIDWFYHSTPIQELVSSSDLINYDTLMSAVNDYWDIPLTIHGTVEKLYETRGESFIRLRDESNHVIVLKYANPISSMFVEPDVPNVTVGETVSVTCYLFAIHYPDSGSSTMYQHLSGHLASYSQKKEYFDALEHIDYFMNLGITEDEITDELYPVMTLFYLKRNNDHTDPLNLKETYQEICEYPLYYLDTKSSFTGTVRYEFSSSEENVRNFLLQKENTTDFYYVSYSPGRVSTGNLTGKTITFNGTFQENAKVPYYDASTTSSGYLLLPKVTTAKLKRVKKTDD